MAAAVVSRVPGVTREGIAWRTVGSEVEILVEVGNDGDEPTEEATLVVEAAPLGAFVPGRPVARVAVGAMDPGERRRVKARVPRAVLPLPPVAAESDLRRLTDVLTHLQWAGNIEVYFDRPRAVEVHRGDMQIPADATAGVVFHLPCEGVRTQLRCEGEGWQTERLNLGGGHAMVLVTAGPRGTSATVTVDVTRDRDGRTVPVDLTFGAR